MKEEKFICSKFCKIKNINLIFKKRYQKEFKIYGVNLKNLVYCNDSFVLKNSEWLLLISDILKWL